MRPSSLDLELLGEAVRALRRGQGPALHPTAAAVRTQDGAVHVAVGLGTRCAEPAALGAALASGSPVATLVAVVHVDADTTRVVAPCPSCRTLLQRHAPGVRVLHLADGLRVGAVRALP